MAIQDEIKQLYSARQAEKAKLIQYYTNKGKNDRVQILQSAGSYGEGVAQIMMNLYQELGLTALAPPQNLLVDALNVPVVLVQNQAAVTYKKANKDQKSKDVLKDKRIPLIVNGIVNTSSQLGVQPVILDPAKILGINY